jgi:hypothetical protein
VALASPATSQSDAQFRDVLLRWPSKRPQKGRQAILDVVDAESWAGRDDDFSRALAWTPGAFTWVRDRAHLVELPALWCRVPVRDRDPDDLAEAITSTLVDEGCPVPHLIFQGEAHLTVLWAIKPLRRPKKDAPDSHHFAFRRCLEDWRKAAIKLSFALEPVGALPLDPALVDELMLGFVPLPPPSNSPLLLALGLHQTAPRLVTGAGDIDPIVIADVSKPLGRKHDTRMFATLGINKAKSKKEWLRSARSLAALEAQAAGGRHPAAIDIVCGCVWDGLEYEATLAKLRAWASTCVNDGKFPFRRGKGDELELLAMWGHARLKPGGPNKPSSKRHATSTTRDGIAAAVVGFLKGEGGTWSGSKRDLAKQVALWSLAAGAAGLCPLTTLKRALSDLYAAGALLHTVARRAATWASTWTLPATASHAHPEASAPAISTIPELSDPRVQKGESTWAPGLASPALPQRGGAAGGILPPAGGGPGGESEPQAPALIDGPAVIAVSQAEHQPPPAPSPETSTPRQRRLPLPREEPGESTKRRRRRGTEGVGLPPLTDELLLELADVAPSLDEAARRTLLETARSRLRPREKVLADFAGALRKRAMHLHRRQHAENARPEPVHEERRRLEHERQAAAELAQPPADTTTIPDFRRLLRLAETPLHDRSIEDIARRLHDEGLSLIPLVPGTKEPAIATWSELQHERMPLSRLRRHLKELGIDTDLAIICGRVSDLMVADLDDESAVAWAETHLPMTPWRTKTARGQHWYYRHPREEIDTRNPPWKGQLQGDGRYVVAPGGLHPDGGRYEALGDWSQPREALPVFDPRWLVDVETLRAARLKILKEQP